MITRDDKLQIFEDFYVDRELPKFKKRGEEHSTNSVIGSSVEEWGGQVTRDQQPLPMTQNFNTEDASVVNYLQYLKDSQPSLRNKLRYFVVTNFVFTRHGKGKNKKESINIDYENISQFFSNMHLMMKDLGIKDKDVAYYETLINNAKSLGQIALAEKLMSQRGLLIAELSMIKEHKVSYITGDEVVEYYKKAKHSKNLHMTWIRNYARIIPPDAVELKKYCDEKGWFDNYVVLHFDRKGDSAMMTKAEKERAKDPILFGMIEGSDKLYHIADWTDEYCDLTLDKMLSAIGKESLKLNNASLKKHIQGITA